MGRYAAMTATVYLRLNTGTMSGDGAVHIICIQPVFNITIWLNTNTLFGLFLAK